MFFATSRLLIVCAACCECETERSGARYELSGEMLRRCPVECRKAILAYDNREVICFVNSACKDTMFACVAFYLATDG